MNAATAEAAAKRGKLVRRTRVGLALTGVLLLALWGAIALDSTLPVLALSLLVLGACILEVRRMGALRELHLEVPLFLAALQVGWLSWDLLASADDSLRDHRDSGMGLLWLPHALLLALPAVLAGHALVRGGSLLVRAAGTLLAALMFARAWLPEGQRETILLALALFVALRVLLIGAPRPREALATVLLGAILCVSLPGFAWIWAGYGAGGLLTLLAICKVGDSAGYYAGSTLGRHHPFKRISPGKTAEGCVASLLGGAAVGAAAVATGLLPAEPLGLWGGLLGGAAVNVAGQASDLLESWVKRKAGVKDSATYLGPSGGLLDLADSFLLATPAALALWPFLFAPDAG